VVEVVVEVVFEVVFEVVARTELGENEDEGVRTPISSQSPPLLIIGVLTVT
jgi:hypothetical protein